MYKIKSNIHALLFLFFSLSFPLYPIKKITEDQIKLYDNTENLKPSFKQKFRKNSRRYKETKIENLKRKQIALMLNIVEQIIKYEEIEKKSNKLKKEYNKKYGTKYVITQPKKAHQKNKKLFVKIKNFNLLARKAEKDSLKRKPYTQRILTYILTFYRYAKI